VFNQVGAAAEVPDAEDPALLVAAFNALQALMDHPALGPALLAYHDVSDGGALVAALEMAFAGDAGFDIDLPAAPAGAGGPLAACFAEELGALLEVAAGSGQHGEALAPPLAAAGLLRAWQQTDCDARGVA
jgi:phosphoribosylformylglycinamidine synthase